MNHQSFEVTVIGLLKLTCFWQLLLHSSVGNRFYCYYKLHSFPLLHCTLRISVSLLRLSKNYAYDRGALVSITPSYLKYFQFLFAEYLKTLPTTVELSFYNAISCRIIMTISLRVLRIDSLNLICCRKLTTFRVMQTRRVDRSWRDLRGHVEPAVERHGKGWYWKRFH